MSRRVAVIGAGISGLAAAHALSASAGLEVVLLEASARLGGKLAVSEVGGVAVDAGAEAMLARAPEGVALATAVGLGDRIVHPAATSAGIWVDGRTHAIPARTLLGVPTDAAAVRESGLLTTDQTNRIDTEAGEPGEPMTADATVAEVIGGRLGAAVVDRLVEPLLGGVYAGRADVLSLQATMPALARGLLTTPSVVAAARQALGAAPRTAGPVFATLRGGLGGLPGAVAAAAGAGPADVRLRLGTTVREIHRTPTGFRLVTGPVPEPDHLDVDAVIVATPAAKSAGLLRDVAPAAARELAGIEYASTAIVTLAFAGAVPLPPGSSGVLVPAVTGRAVKALTYSSQKWDHLAGPVTIVRASLGRHRDEHVLQRDDVDVLALARADLAAITGITAAPVDSRVTRWGGALPQYALGHLDRVARVHAAVESVPGLAVCGAAYDGVGVPACIRTGQQAAARVLAGLPAGGESGLSEQRQADG